MLGWLAQRRLGGYTGDVLGAAQQIAEVCLIAAEHMPHHRDPLVVRSPRPCCWRDRKNLWFR